MSAHTDENATHAAFGRGRWFDQWGKPMTEGNGIDDEGVANVLDELHQLDDNSRLLTMVLAIGELRVRELVQVARIFASYSEGVPNGD